MRVAICEESSLRPVGVQCAPGAQRQWCGSTWRHADAGRTSEWRDRRGSGCGLAASHARVDSVYLDHNDLRDPRAQMEQLDPRRRQRRSGDSSCFSRWATSMRYEERATPDQEWAAEPKAALRRDCDRDGPAPRLWPAVRGLGLRASARVPGPTATSIHNCRIDWRGDGAVDARRAGRGIRVRAVGFGGCGLNEIMGEGRWCNTMSSSNAANMSAPACSAGAVLLRLPRKARTTFDH